ncbi:MAG: hypothetical protein U1E15_12000 [Hyphomicrobiales bacterium]
MLNTWIPKRLLEWCLRLFLIVIFGFLTVGEALSAIDVNKSFSPATVYPTQISHLKIVLQNSALSPTLNAAFTDVFPDHVMLAATPNTATTCGGTVTATNLATHGEISLSGGTIPAGDGTNPGTCMVTVDVIANAKGTYVNDIAAGDVTGLTGGSPDSNSQLTQGTLAAILQDLTYNILTDLSSYGYTFFQGYETTMFRVRLTNPNPVPLTNASFSLPFYSNAPHITPVDDGSQGTSCSTGSVSITPHTTLYPGTFGDSGTIAFAGGTIPANGSCDVYVKIKPSRDPQATRYETGYYLSIPTGGITTSEGATNSTTDQDYIWAGTGISVSKTFNGGQISTINKAETATAKLRLTFSDHNTQSVSGINFTDPMPAADSGGGQMTIDSVDANTCGATVSNSPTPFPFLEAQFQPPSQVTTIPPGFLLC